ncbi:atlastin-2 [Ditylenchus destructor]|uniref:Atlastin-2 n=1 Tax=Ditylenchus destructor TaxID=166010 RepID=A0AAD4MDJ7_9BILA|nr:atlastin-2 [Ditylenchus destructor]
MIRDTDEPDHLHGQVRCDSTALRVSGLGNLSIHLGVYRARFCNPKEFAYGLEGGKAYLESKLNLGDGQSSQLKNIKGFVWNTFDRVECCLSPYPGESVDQGDADYMTSINDKFVDVLEDLAATLLHPANLVPKQVAGQDITCSEFLNLLKSYAKPLENGNCIGPNTILQANAKLRNIKLRNELLKKYSDSARQALENNLWLNANEMHYKLKGNVLHDFDKAKKLGGDAMAAKHREELENDIESTYAQHHGFLNKMREGSMAEEKAIGFRTYVDSMNRSMQSTPAKEPLEPAHLSEMHQEHRQTALKSFQERIEQYNSGLLDYDCGPAHKGLCDDITVGFEEFIPTPIMIYLQWHLI